MNFYDVINKNNKEVNKLVSKQMRLIMMLLFLVWILNIRGIFVINSSVFNVLLIVSGVFLLLPTVLIDLLDYQNKIMAYVILICVIVFISVSYTYLTFHIVLLFAIPMAIASLYFNPNITRFTFVASCVGMLISHLLSCNLRVVRHDPLDTYYRIMVYGFVPKLVELIVYYFVFVCLAKRSSKMLKQTIMYADDLQKSKEGIDVIVMKTKEMYAAEGFWQLANTAFSALQDLFNISGNEEETIKAYFVVSVSRDYFLVISNDGERKKVKRTPNEMKINLDGMKISLPYFVNRELESFQVCTDYLILPFYENHNLSAFLVVHNEIKSLNASKLYQGLELFRGNVLLGIGNMRLKKNIFQTQEELVRAFAEVCESKSKQTGQHVKRVSEYMRVMAEALDLQEQEKDNLVIASMMHDIGKLLVSSDILEKKGKLTDEEFFEIKKHVQYGYELLKNSPGRIMEIGSTIALQHHEKWNGQGYLGIAGENIDYYSRIMAVVDVFDALVSKRSYKEKWSMEDAYNEIVSQSGQHFDPAIVKLFVENFEAFKEIVESYPD